MVYFNHLPDIVKKLVLQYAANPFLSLSDRFKIISVCQEWRTIAKPFVYSEVRIADLPGKAHQATTVTADYQSYSQCPSSFISNIELILLTGSVDHVRAILFEVKSVDSFLALLKDFSDILALRTTRWTSVRKLGMRLGTNHSMLFNRDYSFYSQSPVNFQNAFVGLSDALITHIPSVKALELRVAHNDLLASTFCNMLACGYIHQLHSLRSFPPLSFAEPYTASHITSLDIGLNASSACLLPQLNADQLRYVYLRNVPHKFNWNAFGDPDYYSVFTFSNLEFLSLEFSSKDSHGEVGNIPALSTHFPRLKDLSVCDMPHVTSLFCSSVFPDHLKSFTVVDSTQGLSRSPGIYDVKSVTNTNIGIYSATDESGFYSITNHILGTNSICQESEIILGDIGFVIAPLLVDWSLLGNLQLLAITHYSTLVGLIPRMSALTYLNITCLELDAEFAPDIYNNASIAQITVEPFGTNIKNLTVSYVSKCAFTDAGTECLKLLLKRLVRLETFSTDFDESDHLKAFAAEHMDQYPHFANLVFDY